MVDSDALCREVPQAVAPVSPGLDAPQKENTGAQCGADGWWWISRRDLGWDWWEVFRGAGEGVDRVGSQSIFGAAVNTDAVGAEGTHAGSAGNAFRPRCYRRHVPRRRTARSWLTRPALCYDGLDPGVLAIG